ncbi:MAG: Tol-Pal system protein TolB [Burkholderiales bacterium]|nr:Tol-Pal system protein TolB [Burkholderiales bacterium]MDE2395598.1 Tol-Pal system protein TolB [Burkholderiales bacterium]MDE2453059.1 Tol-Pal system protein TolB [Burkholderiales bacterium]
MAAPALAQFRIQISGVGATQIPLVVANFRDEDKAGVSIAGIVRADLYRSGQFSPSASPVALDELSNVVDADWRSRGADALVAGSVTRLADGRFDVRFKLWDVVKGGQLIGQSQTVVAGDLRLAAHRIADEIVLKLTGVRGVNATRIAYVVRNGRRYTLYITDADGEGGQVALASPEPIISPSWSPDGRQLAYVSFESHHAVVWVQNLATGSRRQLAGFPGTNSAPAWSPDGKELAVTLSRGGPAQLFIMPAGGGQPRRLVSSSAIDTEPVFSADGKWIYFVSDRGGAPQIYRVPPSGGNPERVTFSGNYNVSPSLSPDAKLMAYIDRAGGAYKLMTQDLETSAVQALTDTRDDESPSFAPNGRLIVYATRAQGRNVLMTTTLDGKIKTSLLSSSGEVSEPAWGPFGR